MASKVVVALGALLLTAGCQLPGSSPTCNAQIDWVNFIQVGTTQYVAGLTQAPTVLQESDLGPVYAHVKFKVSGSVCDPNYQLKDGPIYQLSRQPPGEQLAARFSGQVVVYRATAPTS